MMDGKQLKINYKTYFYSQNILLCQIYLLYIFSGELTYWTVEEYK
jgi:hypothetical protein